MGKYKIIKKPKHGRKKISRKLFFKPPSPSPSRNQLVSPLVTNSLAYTGLFKTGLHYSFGYKIYQERQIFKFLRYPEYTFFALGYVLSMFF